MCRERIEKIIDLIFIENRFKNFVEQFKHYVKQWHSGYYKCYDFENFDCLNIDISYRLNHCYHSVKIILVQLYQ